MFFPQPLDDEWIQWIVGEWEGWGESDSGKEFGHMLVHLSLNGQFVVYEYDACITEISEDHETILMEHLHAAKEEIERYQDATFRSFEISTLDPKSGGVLGYLFDSLRCIATGGGWRKDNKEIIEWRWHDRGGKVSSRRITEKLSRDELRITEKFNLADGTTFGSRTEMFRIK